LCKHRIGGNPSVWKIPLHAEDIFTFAKNNCGLWLLATYMQDYKYTHKMLRYELKLSKNQYRLYFIYL